jgi:hypothetical protein
MRTINTLAVFVATLWAVDLLAYDGLYFRAFRDLLALAPH